MRFSRAVRLVRTLLTTLLVLGLPGAGLRAQQHPVNITGAESTALPYRLSGRLNVTFGDTSYFGTSTYIRRYTGLTAGHLLYDPDNGFGTALYYEPGFYLSGTTQITISYFAVLDGYQKGAGVDPDSNGAFAYDMGYVLFARPAANAEWAVFGANPAALTAAGNFTIFGYASGTEKFPTGNLYFSGNELAIVNVDQPYYQLVPPALFENANYYTVEGMSGGPAYTSSNGTLEVVAETVAGTDPPDEALSDVRAITDAEATLFTEAEYAHGLITGGVIHGPGAVAAGGSYTYKAGVVFKDGVQEVRDLTPRYDEINLVPLGAHKKKVSVNRLKTGKYRVTFDARLQSGTTLTLGLLRSTVAKTAQTPLQTMTVTVQ